MKIALCGLQEEVNTFAVETMGLATVTGNMATPIGANDPVRPNISATLWRTVSDATNKRYYFEFTNMPNLVWIDLKNLNLKDGAPVQSFDMASDINASGEVSGKFQPTKPFEFYKEGGDPELETLGRVRANWMRSAGNIEFCRLTNHGNNLGRS